LAAAAALSGCGLGAGRTPSAIRLTITEGFGRHPLRELASPRAAGEQTVMRLLLANTRVSTRYGGGFVQSIEGLSGTSASGGPVDWFYYVNGVEASDGAAAHRVYPGDRIWWDRHGWAAAMRVPAVVGSFPEPFRHGLGGKRLPVRVECARGARIACTEVADRLVALGVPAARGGLGLPTGARTLRVLVGLLAELGSDPALASLMRGPASSGVYARPDRAGRRLTLLDDRGRPTAELRQGGGLIAATRSGDGAPVWLVAGTDAEGLRQAVAQWREASLHDRFAIAVAPGAQIVPLPPARP
jgi:hypothetical protein